jgi:hypothetical protein
MKKKQQIQKRSSVRTRSVKEPTANPRTRALQKSYRCDDPHRIDFCYRAPTREAADALAAQLKSDTEYVNCTDAVQQRDGKYWVEGNSQLKPLAQELMDRWLHRMVGAGDEHACEFYGWGSLVTLK